MALIIHNSEISDSADYRCEAVNKIDRVETECRLTILCKLLQIDILSIVITSGPLQALVVYTKKPTKVE